MKTAQRILDTAADLFNEHGERNVSASDIALELDISPGNLYYHFKGKEQIVEELYAQFHARVLVTLQQITSQAKGDTKETLAGLAVVSDVLQQFKFISQDIRGINERYPSLRESLSKLLTLLYKALVGLVTLVMNKSKVADAKDAAKLLAGNLLYTLIHFGGYDELIRLDDEHKSSSIEEHLYLHFLPFL